MNPENQPNQQKPNLERIAELFVSEWASDNPKGRASEIYSFNDKFEKEWENIKKGKISYPDNPLLEDLLNGYHLEALLPDFRFMGYLFFKLFESINNFLSNQFLNRSQSFSFELIQALHYSLENNQVEIQIKSLKKKGGISIKNPDLIQIIQNSLFDYFKDNDTSFEMGKNPEEISDWGAYFQDRFAEEKARISKKGRKKGNYAIKRIAFYLWKYFQDNTEIKAEAGAESSREQTRFIFRFLEIYGIIDNPDFSRKEDIISYYLKAYKKSRIKNQKKESRN